MDRYLVITVIGDDRPGLVELLAETIGSNGGNWLESRMAHLAGKFAGVLRVAVDGEHVEKLQQALATLSTRGIRVCAETGDATAEMVRAARLELVGSDAMPSEERVNRVRQLYEQAGVFDKANRLIDKYRQRAEDVASPGQLTFIFHASQPKISDPHVPRFVE